MFSLGQVVLAEPIFYWNAAFDVLTGAVFALVGYKISRRRLEGSERAAMQAFATWWYLLGALNVAGGLTNVAAAASATTFEYHLTFLYVAMLVIVVALWCLGYYLVFLYTGRTWWAWPLGAFYSAFYVWLMYLIIAANPVGITLTSTGTTFEYETPIASGTTVTRILGLLFLLPQLAGALAYGTLFFRARDALVRYRIASVSLSLIVWFGSSTIASLARFNQYAWWQYASQTLTLVAALVILLAYNPPGWIRRRLEGGPTPVPSIPFG